MAGARGNLKSNANRRKHKIKNFICPLVLIEAAASAVDKRGSKVMSFSDVRTHNQQNK